MFSYIIVSTRTYCRKQPPLNTTVTKLYLKDAKLDCGCACWLFDKVVRVVADLSDIKCSEPTDYKSVNDMMSYCQNTTTGTTVTTTWITNTVITGKQVKARQRHRSNPLMIYNNNNNNNNNNILYSALFNFNCSKALYI